MISLEALRDLAEISTDVAVSQRDFDAICDAFSALVDAAEALEKLVTYKGPGWMGLLPKDIADDIRSALRHFNFGEVA